MGRHKGDYTDGYDEGYRQGHRDGVEEADTANEALWRLIGAAGERRRIVEWLTNMATYDTVDGATRQCAREFADHIEHSPHTVDDGGQVGK